MKTRKDIYSYQISSFEDFDKSFPGNFNICDALHPSLTFCLTFQQLHFARNVATILQSLKHKSYWWRAQRISIYVSMYNVPYKATDNTGVDFKAQKVCKKGTIYMFIVSHEKSCISARFICGFIRYMMNWYR